MAQGIVFVYGTCAHEVEAWDEGEPYYFDAQGEKRYAFHPDPQCALDRRTCPFCKAGTFHADPDALRVS